MDRAALDFAVNHGLAYAGWCPAGGWAEDLTAPPGLLAHYRDLTATPSADPRQRTAWNVRDSDLTVIVTPNGSYSESSGSQFTVECAELLFLRPLCVVDLSAPDSFRALWGLLAGALDEPGGDVLDLNVAGPRESGAPGIYQRTRELLDRAWTLRRAPARGQPPDPRGG